MNKTYSYRLHNHPLEPQSSKGQARFTREELEEMTTFELRNICYKERLVEGIAGTLDREELIRTILKFRGMQNTLRIEQFRKGGFERIQSVLGRYLNAQKPDHGSIKVPARIVLYQGIRLGRLDGYKIESGTVIGENVLLVNGNGELCGILNVKMIEDQPGKYLLSAPSHWEHRITSNQNYSLYFTRRQDSDYLYHAYYSDRPLIPSNLHYYRVPVAELEIRMPEPTDTVLAIDFGTSNTTAGAYLGSGYGSMIQREDSPVRSTDRLLGESNAYRTQDAVNYVVFPNVTDKQEQWLELLPTLAAAADCADPDNVRLVYGYDALAYIQRNGHNSRATVFRGMKRWVNDYERVEELMDAAGNTAYLSRSEILKGYISYVVETAEQQFKCRFEHLHISSPVKLKTQFLDMFNQILPDYRIEMNDALDEGMAVLYNTIADQIDKGTYIDGEEYQALVIDCGGGTTDLSSCRFSIHEGRISYGLDIHTSYENGDTNFGGNNITYRIMQWMKIVFAEWYSGQQRRIDMDALIDIPGAELFRYVDEYGIKAVYEGMDARYLEAEKIIPTKYRDYEHHSRDEYQRVRGNFYFLWAMADQMKQEFFRKTGILRSRFQDDNETILDSDIKITKVDRWFLSISEPDGRLRNEYRPPDVVFNIREINQLIKADIYEIVRKFLDEFYQDGRLQDYSIIKLTGQSCRIDVFREALKEFVPGRSIEFRQKAKENSQVPDLKLACLRGAIRYLNAKKIGMIKPVLTNEIPAIPYSVSAYTHTRQEKMLIRSLERNRTYGNVSRPQHTSEIEFFVWADDGSLRHRYIYKGWAPSFRQVVYEEIAEMYGDHIIQDETDSISNGETKFFVFAGDQRWGFNVVPVLRENEQLYVANRQFFAFENDLSELDFFDGTK
ncbi:hypothetical protein [Paenibacillus bovis]|uniref:Molecular chaperone n=1 Tax=Paenibacillus bovis TaxID=1616788 RepID=A0A172ZJ16_9BACL|nr:hypothetical protein [Paenibacillus bovis]ANF97588.1 molecular chaperone [Paenibacillus bovis]